MNRLLLTLFAALTALSFVACDKDADLDPDYDPSYDYLLDASAEEAVEALVLSPAELEEAYAELPLRGGERFAGQCFSLVYPVTLEFPSGRTATVADSAELKSTIRAWVADRPARSARRLSLVYPVTIQTADGDVEALASRLEMRRALRACAAAPEPCVSLVFPLDVTLGAETVTVDSAAQLRRAIAAYRTANPDGPRAAFAYPVDVEFADGTTATVGSRAEWQRVRATCRGRDLDCFTYVFPVTVVNAEGTTRTIDDLRQLRRILSHANRRGRHTLQFPYTVTLNNGDAYTVAERSDLRQLFGLCD